MHTLFFRLLKHEDKAAVLSEALDAVRQGETNDVWCMLWTQHRFGRCLGHRLPAG